MRNISGKSCRENQNTHFVFNNSIFKNCAVYDKTWKDIVEWSRPEMTKRGMSTALWITMATDICNIYCFSTATIAMQTHFSVMLYIRNLLRRTYRRRNWRRREEQYCAHKHTCCSCRPFCIIPRPIVFGPTPSTAGVYAKKEDLNDYKTEILFTQLLYSHYMAHVCSFVHNSADCTKKYIHTCIYRNKTCYC
jgi:hypothetical protein